MEVLSSHSSYLLQQLQEQRIQGLLCDCMLVVKGVCFKAHKNVLAAFSSYFRSLFQNSPSQKNEVFNLVIQDVGGIGQVLDYMYTSHLEVNQDNVQALMDIAQCLQVPNIQNMCNAFLKPCPPPPSDMTSSSFSLTSEHADCLLDVMSDLHSCPPPSSSSSSEAPRPSFNADLDHAKKLSASVAHSGANCDFADKQLAHSYKLRNFYSKQYFKQSAVETSNAASNQGPSPLVMMDEQQYQATQQNSHPTGSSSSSAQPNPPYTSSSSASTLGEKTTNSSSGHSLTPSEDGLSAPNNNNNTTNNSSSSDQPAADPSLSRSPVRPKKTVYLKKYNYLRSQKTLEEMCAEPLVEPVLAGPKECPQPYPREQTPLVQQDLPEAATDDSCCPSESRDHPQEAPPPTASTDRPAESRDHHQAPPPPPLPDTPPDDTQQLPTTYDPGPPASPPPAAEDDQPGPKIVSVWSSGAAAQQQAPGHKQYCCEVCGKIFKHPSNLMLHKRMHTGEKPFQCNVCGKNFSQAGNLQTHLRRHSGEKPYICELCGKSFAAAGDVQRHIVVHTGQKPHLCDICGRGFSNFSNLKEHKKTHTADQTCTCDQCGKTFNMEKKLLKHKARHNGEKTHRCDTCGKCFMDTGDLRRHVRSHTGERPYLCNACGKSFTRCALLRRHSSTTCRGAPPPPPALPEALHSELFQTAEGSDGTAAASSFPNNNKKPRREQSPYPTQKPPASAPSLGQPKHKDPPGTGALLGAPSTSSSLPLLLSSSSSSSVHQEKCPNSSTSSEPGLKPHAAAAKPHIPQEAAEAVYGGGGGSGHYVESGSSGVMAVEMAARPSYLLPVDGQHQQQHCVSLTAATNSSSSSRASGGSSSYRASGSSGDGQFISSVTLWGLAMKTLQNENDMEQ